MHRDKVKCQGNIFWEHFPLELFYDAHYEYVERRVNGMCTVSNGKDIGNWKVYYPSKCMKYTDAKAKCSSLGATLVGEDALDTVRFLCHFVALTLV